MAKATRSLQAQYDLRDLARYIADESQSVDAAVRVIDRIDQRVQLCLSQPEMGQLCPELGEDVRRTVVEAYSIFYRKSPRGIQVLRIIHASRDLSRAWNE